MRPATRQHGFSLIETVVAAMILCGAVVALGAVSTNVLRDSRVNQHYEAAASVLERQFTLIDATGIDQFIETDQMEGVYDQAEPGYRWRVETEYKEIDDLYLVTVTVEWMEGSRPYRVVGQTFLDGTSLSRIPAATPGQTPESGGSS
jgi:type II secretory pathway pseudopilin PulG